MNRRNLDFVKSIIFISALFACTLHLSCVQEPRPGKPLEVWETANDIFKVRISVYAEGNSLHALEGTHYTFESAPVESSNWYKFSNAYFSDGRRSIPSRNVGFVTDKIAYVFLQDWYKVTLDGGSRWISVHIPTQVPGKIYSYLDLIQDVQISSNGKGTMRIVPGDPEVPNKVITLLTEDYGQHWNAE